MPLRETQRADAPTPAVADAEAREVGAASTRTQIGAAPRWVVPALVIAALVLAVVNILTFDGGADGWILLAVLMVLVIGVALALNPRRRSIPGGTVER